MVLKYINNFIVNIVTRHTTIKKVKVGTYLIGTFKETIICRARI